MKLKMTGPLFSLTTAFVLFTILAALFAAGSTIDRIPEVKSLFREMNSTHIWNAVQDIARTPVLLGWLAALVVVAAGLFVNTFCCTIKQISRHFNQRKTTTPLKGLTTMAFIHVLALGVIIFHSLDVSLIKRHKPVKILENQSVELSSYRVTVQSISYATDRKFIRENERGHTMPSFKIPRTEFSTEENRAIITISTGKRQVTKEIGLFEPVRIGTTFFILDGFFIPHGKNEIGISIHHSNNPLAIPFFALYTLLFSTLLWHGLHTRYKAPPGQNEI